TLPTDEISTGRLRPVRSTRARSLLQHPADADAGPQPVAPCHGRPAEAPGVCPLPTHAAGESLPAHEPAGLHDPPLLECERPIAPGSAQYSRPIPPGSVRPDALVLLQPRPRFVAGPVLSSPDRALCTPAPAPHIHAQARPAPPQESQPPPRPASAPG